MPDGGEAGSSPGRGIRVFVAMFVGLFLITGLVGVEAWPLTGWSLYSRLRHGERWGWQVLAVAPDGAERHLELQRLPAAYHGVIYALGGFAGRPPEEKESACQELGRAVRVQYPDAVGVAIDRVRYRIPTEPDLPPSPPTERVRNHRCRLG